MAAASGCSLDDSTAATVPRSSSSVKPSVATSAASLGRPSVSVPVLSTTSTVTCPRRSSASAFFTSTPACAPRPTPTMMLIGVARPSAHGHAMMSTATAFTSACARRGSGPSHSHSTKVSTAAPSTAGTNHPATRSASAWIGARLRCASATICTMRASIVSLPTRSARMRNPPVPLIVPPVTASPAAFATGMGSPVSMDSSTLELPSVIFPSTGIFSPGRTRSIAPTATRSSGTSRSPSASTSRAVAGARSSSARIAVPVRARARNSSTCPASTRTMMTAAASK